MTLLMQNWNWGISWKYFPVNEERIEKWSLQQWLLIPYEWDSENNTYTTVNNEAWVIVNIFLFFQLDNSHETYGYFMHPIVAYHLQRQYDFMVHLFQFVCQLGSNFRIRTIQHLLASTWFGLLYRCSPPPPSPPHTDSDHWKEH